MYKQFTLACLFASTQAVSILNSMPVSAVESLLNQLRAQATPTCNLSFDRAKTPSDDFYGILNSSGRYTDSDFTADSTSLYWADLGEPDGPQYYDESYIAWERASDKLNGATLFGANGISNKDIQ